MYYFKVLCFCILFAASQAVVYSQPEPDMIFQKNIRSVRFHVYGDELSMPVYKLNTSDRLELHFDDMDGNVKSYYYTYQLCDYNWEPVNLSPFDFIKGFTQQRITNYRYSSIAYTRYTHYQVYLPEENALPARSGNYILKVFLDGDTSNLVFTRRMLVLENKSSISAQIVQPFTPGTFKTHQRVRFSISIEGLNAFNPAQQVKVLVLQNYRWDNAQGNAPPTFIRGKVLDYNNESNFVFSGGKEWRWLDLRSLRLQSDRVQKADYKKDATEIYVHADMDRSSQRYLYYQDYNGLYQAITYETINPYTQGDYATVHFSYLPPNHMPYQQKDIFLFGQLTDYKLDSNSRMQFNTETGLYECSLYLKQGYYSYGYMLADKNDPVGRTLIDGDYYETENTYTILVYYRSFTDQSDQLIGVAKVSSRTDKPGISF